MQPHVLEEYIEHAKTHVSSDAYNLAAPFYDKWKWQSFWRSTETPYVVDAVQRHLESRVGKAKLLDVGCGTGFYIKALDANFSAKFGVDSSDAMLSIARSRCQSSIILKADVRDLPFHGNKFDVILCTRVLSHVKNWQSALTQISNRLASGGLLILSSVDEDHSYESTKLPVADGSVWVETYKHPRKNIRDVLKNLNMSVVSEASIYSDGEVISSPYIKSTAAVGWVSVFKYS